MNNHKEEQLLKQMIEILAQESGETVSVEGKTPEEYHDGRFGEDL